jgi:transglutaminase/protease-like cytokinesis protein 3
MKTVHKSTIALALIFFSTSIIGAQDLSKYRNFSLGTSVAGISKQVDATPSQVSVTHQSPVLIQELTWWPIESSESSRRAEAVEQIHFSFCNRELYKIVAKYEDTATKGLTADDMVRAISATYGIARRPAADLSAPAQLSYSSADLPIALWENARYSVALSQSPLSDSFQLTLLLKQLNGQAEAGIVEAVRQETEGAPQRETARVKKEADDLEAMRQANLKSFRP